MIYLAWRLWDLEKQSWLSVSYQWTVFEAPKVNCKFWLNGWGNIIVENQRKSTSKRFEETSYVVSCLFFEYTLLSMWKVLFTTICGNVYEYIYIIFYEFFLFIYACVFVFPECNFETERIWKISRKLLKWVLFVRGSKMHNSRQNKSKINFKTR